MAESKNDSRLTLADVVDVVRRFKSVGVLSFDIGRANELTSKPEELQAHDRNGLLSDSLQLLLATFEVRFKSGTKIHHAIWKNVTFRKKRAPITFSISLKMVLFVSNSTMLVLMRRGNELEHCMWIFHKVCDSFRRHWLREWKWTAISRTKITV